MAALKLPIDTSGFTFTASTPPEPVMDRETNAQKADENGEALFSIQVVAFGEGGAQIWAVKFPGAAPAGVKRGADVKLTGLVASPWVIEGRAGLSFRATRIEAVNGAGPKGGAQ